jgi:Protein of unknown function (DUF1194)
MGAAMRRRTLLTTMIGTAATFDSRPMKAQTEPDTMDVLLVLAVDVSRSIDDDEARLQRQGYRNAIADPRVVEAIRGGMLGAIGLAYVEWAGIEYQRLVIPWTRIASQADAEDWATALDRAPRQSLSWTSVSGGIDFSRRVLGEAPWQATRRVIDVSGDGENNSGPPVEQARDRAVTEGITINGLPILNDRPGFGVPSAVPLDEYYRQNVVGGPGAFVIAVEEFESFGLAVRRKLIREISDIPPVPRMAARASAPKPTEAGEGAASRPEADLATDGD